MSMAVDMRDRDSRLPHALDLRANLGRELIPVDAPRQRAPGERAQRKELARAAIGERWDAQQRTTLHEIQVHAHVERARRARESHRALPIEAVRHHQCRRHAAGRVRLDDAARHAIGEAEIVGVDDRAARAQA